MKKITLLLLLSMFLGLNVATAQDEEPTEEQIAEYQAIIDSISNSLKYEYGTITLEKGGTKLATLVVPEGYKYLNPKQTDYVLTELWGNPSSGLGLGMLFPKDVSPVGEGFTYGVEIDYSDEGYIDDSEAQDLDYTALLTEMQTDAKGANEERVKQGYEPIELVGWAAKPFYDSKSKKLHWAKELKFGEAPGNTLNYNIRILGRGGYLNLNAIGEMSVLPIFEKDVNAILGSVNFIDGQKYSDFDSSVDKVAAYGIGGLIAGKVLAKVGFFVLLVKFWKLIALGVVAAFIGVKKMFFGNKTA